MLMYILLIVLLVALCLAALGAIVVFVVRSEPVEHEWSWSDLCFQLFDCFTQIAIDLLGK